MFNSKEFYDLVRSRLIDLRRDFQVRCLQTLIAAAGTVTPLKQDSMRVYLGIANVGANPINISPPEFTIVGGLIIQGTGVFNEFTLERHLALVQGSWSINSPLGSTVNTVEVLFRR